MLQYDHFALVVQWIEQLRPKEKMWAESVWETVSGGCLVFYDERK